MEIPDTLADHDLNTVACANTIRFIISRFEKAIPHLVSALDDNLGGFVQAGHLKEAVHLIELAQSMAIGLQDQISIQKEPESALG